MRFSEVSMFDVTFIPTKTNIAALADPNCLSVLDAGGLPIDTDIIGSNTVTYDVTDSVGNTATQVTRTVDVVDVISPIIALNGIDPVTLTAGIDTYTEDGATVTDNDPAYSETVSVGGDTVDANTVDTYVVTYDAPADQSGNFPTPVTRTVNVIAAPDIIPPVITLLGNDPESVDVNTTYVDAGATASDDVDGDITTNIVTVNPVDITTVGTYVITYDVSDAAENAAVQVTRTVEVVDIDPNVTIIDADTVGNQNVPYDHTLIVTNGATVTGKITLDGGNLILEDNCTIVGNIKSKNGGNVSIDSCTVNGHVRTVGGDISITNDSTVTKNANLKNSNSVSIINNLNSFNQHLRVEGAGSVTIIDNTVDKNLRVKTSGDVTISGNSVGQNLRSFDNVSTSITDNTVQTGNLNARGTDIVTILGNIVNGNIRASDSISVDVTNNNSGENLRVKTSSSVTIDNNQVGKNLRVLDNDDVSVTNNHADKNINIKKNTACIHSGNTGDGKIRIKNCTDVTP